MNLPVRKAALLALAALAASLVTAAAISAHDHRSVGDYQFTVGFAVEPAIEGVANGVDLRVEKSAASQGQDSSAGQHGGTSSGGGMGHDHGELVPVEGLEETLQVEVTHLGSGVSNSMQLGVVFGQPGHYKAALIPTASGDYRFRFFGTVEGNPVDESFESGPNTFSRVNPAGDLQFPERRATIREIEGAVRGAQSSAEGAQDAAMDASDSASAAKMLGIVGIVLGVLGIGAGAGGLALGLRRR